MVGSGADGFANGRAPRTGAVEGPAAPVTGAVVSLTSVLGEILVLRSGTCLSQCQ